MAVDRSQSPQAGQFNSYKFVPDIIEYEIDVSIPSSGSIQFLLRNLPSMDMTNEESQSPQAGQFNSYVLKVSY